MTAGSFAQNNRLDIDAIRTAAVIALRRWAQKNAVIARRRLSKDLHLEPDTISKWLSGERLMPAKYIPELPKHLGTSYTEELHKALLECGQGYLVILHLHHSLQRTGDRHERGPSMACNCNSNRVGPWGFGDMAEI